MLPRRQILRVAILFFGAITVAVLMWRPGYRGMSEIMFMLLIVVAVGLAAYLVWQLAKAIKSLF